jgi:hypothetical protein
MGEFGGEGAVGRRREAKQSLAVVDDHSRAARR